MGYMHIPNLYKEQKVLEFKYCYAMEKIHGTSAHVGLGKDGRLVLFSGGEKAERFAALFNQGALTQALADIALTDITIFGEAYGGKQQGMSATYGAELRFIAFDVKIGDTWLTVPDAQDLAQKCGIEFVYYTKVATMLPVLDAERDADSVQAVRNGMGPGKMREGVVLRPLIETTDRGNRIMAKHKRDEFRETSTPRTVDPGKLAVEADARKIALEWVTETRLDHVLDKNPASTIEETGKVIKAMLEDVLREGEGEIVVSKEAKAAINQRTAQLFKQRLRGALAS